jgi:hypothetical protein
MIIKGGSRQNRRFFARHLTNTKDNDRVRVVEFRGFAHESVDQAFADMEAVAKGTDCKNFFYHASLSPREDEQLTDAQWDGSVDRLEENLGLAGQSRVVFEHEKHGRTHRHAVWSRIDLDTMTARSDSLTYRQHEKTAREIETELQLDPVASVLVKDRQTPRPERRARDWEGFRGSKTGIAPDAVKAEVTGLWKESDSGAAFRAALAERGYLLCKGDRRDFCIIDREGNDHSLARRIDGAKAADIRSSMADIDRDALPSVRGARTERRGDKHMVESAGAAGANTNKVAAAINAARAADVTPLSADPDGERVRRDEYEKLITSKRQAAKESVGMPTPEPPPGAPRPEWQAREQARKRDRELER